MNIACTRYRVVRKVGRQICNYKLKEFREDAEGTKLKKNQDVEDKNLKKLSTKWDFTWHDGPITSDFLARMLPYQKVNMYPGMYVITKKNYLARNLMRMQKCFPDEYNFFPRTWVLPFEHLDLR